jgi:hypothetical protein
MFRGRKVEGDAQYVIIPQGTDPSRVLTWMNKVWQLPLPSLLLSVTGGADRMDMRAQYELGFTESVASLAQLTDAWVVDGGTAAGVMQLVGNAKASYQGDEPFIGITPLGCVKGRDCFDDYDRTKNVPGNGGAYLDENHTHYILVAAASMVTNFFDSKLYLTSTDGFPATPLRGSLSRLVMLQSRRKKHYFRYLRTGSDDQGDYLVIGPEQLAHMASDGCKPEKGKDEVHFIAWHEPENHDERAALVGNWGYEIGFRTSLEKVIVHMLPKMVRNDNTWQELCDDGPSLRPSSPGNQESKQLLPIVHLVVGGGPGSVQTLTQAFMSDTPVVLMKGSGRACDLFEDWCVFESCTLFLPYLLRFLTSLIHALRYTSRYYGHADRDQKMNSLLFFEKTNYGDGDPKPNRQLRKMLQAIQNCGQYHTVARKLQERNMIAAKKLCTCVQEGRKCMCTQEKPEMYFFDPKTHHTNDVLQMVFRALQGDHHLDDQLKLLLAVKWNSESQVADYSHYTLM